MVSRTVIRMIYRETHIAAVVLSRSKGYEMGSETNPGLGRDAGQRVGGNTVRKKVWLLLAVVAVLLAVCVFRRASTPSPVSGGEVPPPAAVTIPVLALRPPSVKVGSSPAPKVSPPQAAVPVVATEAGPAEQEELSGAWTPKVEAILADTGHRFCALVGDALVSEGSMIHGYRVRKVQADGVEFEKDGQIWVQKLD